MNNETPTRNIIAKGLGVLWILDGLLQFQPAMFGPDFVNNVLAPTLENQPSFMHAAITWGINLWSTNMVVSDIAAALLQIAIGVLLLFPLSSKTFRTGLWVSILWGIVVFICGEGASMLLTGSATLYNGAPGAVLIYVLIAALLLVPEKVRVASYPKIAAWILVACALLCAQTNFWTTDGAQSVFMTSAMDGMHAISAVPNFLSTLMSAHPVTADILLMGIPFVVGLLLLLKPSRITGGIMLAFLFAAWWLGQDFGQLSTLFTGVCTDPNTAPLLALMLVPLFVGNKGIRNLASFEQKASTSQ